MTPTESGLALYHHARFVLRQMDQGAVDRRQESGPVQGMVSVGLPATTLLAVGLPLIKRSAKNIRVSFSQCRRGHERTYRADDAARATGPRYPVHQQRVSSKLDATPLLGKNCSSCSPDKSGYLPARRTTMTVDEVARLPLILPTSKARPAPARGRGIPNAAT